jgi:hypothetical protein
MKMMSNLCLLILLLGCSWFVTEAQQFNVFKSYKDAKVKPIQYGKVIKDNHPVTEYLDDKQMKMLRERNGPVTSENVFDNKWSGFKDKSVLAGLKKNRAKKRKNLRGGNRSKGSADGDVGEYLPTNESEER